MARAGRSPFGLRLRRNRARRLALPLPRSLPIDRACVPASVTRDDMPHVTYVEHPETPARRWRRRRFQRRGRGDIGGGGDRGAVEATEETA